MAQITAVNETILQTKTKEQRKIITEFFLFKSGCGNREMTENEYLSLVKNKYDSLKLKEKALQKLGIDESQVQEIEPVEFVGFSYEDDYFAKGNLTSKYESTWIFFSDTQIYVYSYLFDMTSNSTKERTEEYFYKDVTSFSSSTKSLEIITSQPSGCGSSMNSVKGSIDMAYFSIVVPGDKFNCTMQSNDTTEKIIQGMKQKLREKKNS